MTFVFGILSIISGKKKLKGLGPKLTLVRFYRFDSGISCYEIRFWHGAGSTRTALLYGAES